MPQADARFAPCVGSGKFVAAEAAMRLQHSLRAKIAFGVALPILIVLSAFSVFHYERERHLLASQIDAMAQQLGDLAMGSVRHALKTNDGRLLGQVLRDLNSVDTVRQVQIVDADNQVAAASLPTALGKTFTLADAGCVECHGSPTPQPPSTARLSTPPGLMRVARLIVNEPDCAGCHAEPKAHLGVLLVDLSVADAEQHLLNDLRVDLLLTASTTVLATLGIYLLIHRLVVRRVAAVRRPLASFAQGNFRSRLPISLAPSDEIDEFSVAFNHMADELERHIRQEKERGSLRQRAIVEERERIARELHDGMAQLLGYVSTKAMAVRLMLKNGQIDAAGKHLQQLDEAAQALFVDVREAIIGLKITGRNGEGLPSALREFTTQYCQLCGVPVELSIAPAAEDLPLPAETELQLVRIVQEALANVRKHASANRASVSLRRENGHLELVVRDDGVGFDPDQLRAGQRPHFGLGTMRERAEAIGAEFNLSSQPGAGTSVRVRLPLEGTGLHARAGRG
jgi:signal transduction histidine kinase